MSKQHDVPWWDREPDTEASKEELLDQIKNMQMAQRAVPRWFLFKQFLSIVYIFVTGVMLYLIELNFGFPMVGYVAGLMLPLIILLLDYIRIVGKLRDMARNGR